MDIQNVKNRHVTLNKDFYELQEINEMLEKRIISHIKENFLGFCEESHEPVEWKYDKDFVVFLDDYKELNVICKDGQYVNVLIANEGKEIFVTL